MDLTAFLTDLLVKPQTEANKILLRLVKILFVLLLSLAFWCQIGGALKLPKEFSLLVLFEIFTSGQVIIPIFMILIVSILINLMENFILPLIIVLMSFLIRTFFGGLFYLKFIALRNKQVKKAIAIMWSVGFIQIQYKKIKKGIFFKVFKFYATNIDISKISKEHLTLLSFLVQFFCIWVFVIVKGDFCPDVFFSVVKYISIALIVYIPFNLSMLYVIDSLGNPMKDLISVLENQNNNQQANP